MTSCRNGGRCLYDKEMKAFYCSCLLPWKGDTCEGKFV